MTTDITQQIGRIWDEDAANYDRSHSSQLPPHARAAWRATLRRLLPDPPASVLDVGAGTGFVSLLLAGLGYQVTAVDFSAQMLAALRSKADRLGLSVRTLHADAAHPPDERFDAVVERDLIWTLPDPEVALATWRNAAPAGRLVLIEGSWGKKTSGVAALQTRARDLKARARGLAHSIQGSKPHQHDNYPQNVVRALPYVTGIRPAEAVCLVENSSWGPARFEWLSDVERAILSDRSLLFQLLGTTHRWAVSAGS